MKIEIGKIIKTVGLKGEFKVYPYTDEPELRFEKGNSIEFNGSSFKITKSRLQKGCPIIQVESITTIDDAMKLIGSIITIDSEDLPHDDGYYAYQLKGFFAVYNDENIGKIIDFQSYGAQTNARIDLGNGKTILVPFIHPFVEHIDEENQSITFINLEGLL